MKDIRAQFWADVYLQGLKSGLSHYLAVENADKALTEFKLRFS